ncbi:Repeat domain-containing protein [Dyadobacter sp. SG02]|uniref:VCBS repeat-containing protein n=1 Tax=Dyadobacter sp. SG02 TaxID=1855291 RepID=UPI0008C664A2|nr:VCBS repeat-containing protein [Dyadobacter sp. SG02]SEJ21762.1 Repeat domain-containing protein [Dyadobacter sp. SG02]
MTRPLSLFLCIIWLICACTTKKNDQKLFVLLSPDETGVHFNNRLHEDDQLNILTYEYFYNGGGVGAGDINNDGLTDLFFTGNMSESKLYVNKSKDQRIEFEDITAKSGIHIPEGWARGVAMVDINADGFLDIYVCRAGPAQVGTLSNLLFINQKNNTFKEEAKAYGLDYNGNTTQAAFFDYDHDGDLDAYLVTNVMNMRGPNNIRAKVSDGSSPNADRLFRNNGNGTFTDVSKESGIQEEGYGLGIAVTDVNNDGWPDVYISNDYVSNDLLYINQHNGTFKNEIASYFKHQSYSAMGNDAADIDNDGLVDFITVDMLPEDPVRRKNMFGLMNYDRHLSELRMGYEPQFMRNTLQHNEGNTPGGKQPVFSEIGRYSGVEATDWSWGALFADYDNDGFRDLMITNGYPKDITNRDFVIYRMAEYEMQMRSGGGDSRKLAEALKKVEGAHVPNYLFANNHDLTFANKSNEWGFDIPSFSNGAVYADFDNDGDLDIAMNNIDSEAFLYENHSERKPDQHSLTVKLKGPALNRDGLGAKIWLWTAKGKQYAEHSPYRGYQSTTEPNRVHFGLGNVSQIDSVTIVWPDSRMQVLKHVKADQWLELDHARATGNAPANYALPVANAPLFAGVQNTGIDFQHKDDLYIDFKIQPLLPHLLSQNGPGVAVADVNGDGLDDFYVGGAFNQSGRVFVQDKQQRFSSKVLVAGQKYEEDMGTLFFDADGDGDHDLYVVSGSNEFEAGSKYYQDRLYINDGKGNFNLNTNALPPLSGSGSTVNAADFDRDGDLDLFVGGRLCPGAYPMPGESYLLRNDGGRFVEITQQVCPEIRTIGMVTTALWTDFDQDGWVDLIVTGEWMPIVFYKNSHGKLRNVSPQTGLKNTTGWWNSIVSGDFDEDGDTDYVLGNVGLNSEGKPSNDKPLTLLAKDFDKSGTMDPVIARYIGNDLYPTHPRDEMNSQMNFLKKRFIYYADYSKAKITDVFKPEELKDAQKLVCETMQSVMLENKGGGKFELKYLPSAAQMGAVYGLVTEDLNQDGHLDLLLSGNTYATESISGRLDGLNGLLMVGDGKGAFKPLNVDRSGIFVPGDAKGMVHLRLGNGRSLVLAAQNNAPLLAFAGVAADESVHIKTKSQDAALVATYADGHSRRFELSYGSGYLSQSGRNVALPREGLTKVVLTDFRGRMREVAF